MFYNTSWEAVTTNNFGELLLASSQTRAKPKIRIARIVFTIFCLVFSVVTLLFGVFLIIVVGIIDGVVEAFVVGVFMVIIGLLFPLLPAVLKRHSALIDVYEYGVKIHMGQGSRKKVVCYTFDEIDWIQRPHLAFYIYALVIKPKQGRILYWSNYGNQVVDTLLQAYAKYVFATYQKEASTHCK